MVRTCISICGGLLLAGGLWLASAAPVAAAPVSNAARVTVLGEWEWWEETKVWFSAQASNRTRVVQFATIGMVVALLILYSASNRKR